MKGHIYSRGKDTWGIKVPTGERYPSGAPKYYYETVHGTRKMAEKRCAEMILEIESGRRKNISNITVGDFLERWLAYIENTDLAPRTLQGYRRICKLHLIPALGRIKLIELGADDLQKFYKHAQEKGRKDDQRVKKEIRQDPERDRSLSARTVLSFHRILHAALEWARRQGWVQQNISELVKPPRPRRRRFRRLTVVEAKTFLKSIEGTPLYIKVLTALLTAFRQGEQLGLRWSDIDFDRQIIEPKQQLVKAGRNPTFRPLLKNEASERQIPMIPMLAEALKAHRKKQLEARIRAGREWKDYDLVFTGPLGEPISGPDLTREEFKRALIKAGLSPIRWYDLRHTTASLLLDLGVDIAIVSRILRHANIQITADTYAEPEMRTLQEALGKMEAVLK